MYSQKRVRENDWLKIQMEKHNCKTVVLSSICSEHSSATEKVELPLTVDQMKLRFVYAITHLRHLILSRKQQEMIGRLLEQLVEFSHGSPAIADVLCSILKLKVCQENAVELLQTVSDRLVAKRCLDSPPDMADLHNLLADLAHKWEQIATCLTVPRSTVEQIKDDYPNNCRLCLMQVLEAWKQHTAYKPKGLAEDNRFCWRTITAALEAKSLQETRLAGEIKSSCKFQNEEKIMKLIELCDLNEVEKSVLCCLSHFDGRPIPVLLVDVISQMSVVIPSLTFSSEKLQKLNLLCVYPESIISPHSPPTTTTVYIPNDISKGLWMFTSKKEQQRGIIYNAFKQVIKIGISAKEKSHLTCLAHLLQNNSKSQMSKDSFKRLSNNFKRTQHPYL